MSNNYEVGKIEFLSSENEKTIEFSNQYSSSPVIKVTCNKNINLFIKEVTNTYFKVCKSFEEDITVHYSVIER